jgi:clan AA aspartic protease
MGYVRVKILIGADEKKAREVEFLEDTGAFYTTISPKMSEEMGIAPIARTKVVLADKRVVEVDVSLAYIKALDREGVLLVAIMEVPEPLLGVTTLEGLGLKVDPTTGKLEYSSSYGLAII